MSKIPALIFSFLIFLSLTKPVQASFNFITSKQTISDTEELTVDVNIDLSSSTGGNSYWLRGAFFKEGTTKYFGYTINNGGTPYNGPYSDCQNLYKITVDTNGDWAGEIKIKPDPESSYFEGSGNYLFKVGRYTTNCNITWADSNPVTIQISQTVFPSPSPTPSPSPLPSPKSPSPTTSSSKSTTTAKSPSPQSSPQGQTAKTQQATVLGGKLESTPTATPTPLAQSRTNKTKIAGILTGSGLVLIAAAIGLFLWFNKRLKTNEK